MWDNNEECWRWVVFIQQQMLKVSLKIRGTVCVQLKILLSKLYQVLGIKTFKHCTDFAKAKLIWLLRKYLPFLVQHSSNDLLSSQSIVGSGCLLVIIIWLFGESRGKYSGLILVLYNPSHLSPPPVLSVQNIISYQTCILLAVDPRIPAQPVKPDHNKQQSECQYSIVI